MVGKVIVDNGSYFVVTEGDDCYSLTKQEVLSNCVQEGDTVEFDAGSAVIIVEGKFVSITKVVYEGEVTLGRAARK